MAAWIAAVWLVILIGMPVAAAPALEAVRLGFTSHQISGDEIALEWTGSGTLQSAESPTGPWVTVPNSKSPFTAARSGDVRFYRLLSTAYSLVAVNETMVRITYDQPMGLSAIDPANYTVASDQGAPIQVLGAKFGLSRQVVELATTPQSSANYELTINNVQDSTEQSVYFDGRVFSGNPKGAVVSAAATSSTRVVVVFNEPMADNALAPQNFSIRDSTGKSLMVTDADFDGPLTMVVVLTTVPQAGVPYTLTVNNVTDLGGDPLALTTKIANFQGVGAVGLSRAIPTDSTHITLTFTSAVGDSALAPSTYLIDQLDAANNVVGKLQITSAGFLGDERKVVELTTKPQQNTRYRISTTSGLTDPAGNVLPSSDVQFDGIRGQPSLALVASIRPTSVLVTFNVPMSDDVLSPAAYGISQLDDPTKTLEVMSVGFVGSERRVVELTTAPQSSVNYVIRRLDAGNIHGVALLLPPTPGVNLFTGNASPSGTPAVAAAPRVVGAASLGNLQVIVAFSEPMSSSAIQPENYVVVQENVNPQAGFLRVVAAEFYKQNPSTVLLTTSSQSELVYRVTVVNATDLSGVALADRIVSNGVLVDPTSVVFPGTPPIGFGDADGDGLADNIEMRGWIVTVRNVDGTTSSRGVTSDPLVADTDGDGLNDAQEANLRFDPRSIDTDDDQINDYAEFNEVYSNGLDQDTDRDSLDDFLEFAFFHTSPLFEDTDGDQISDANEIIGSRNPRVSDLPRPEITVGEVNLQLNVKFTESNAQQRRELETKSVSTTLSASTSQTYTRQDTVNTEVHLDAGTTDTDYATYYFRAGFSVGYTFQSTDQSETATAQAYARSLSTDRETTRGFTTEREVLGAVMQVAVDLRNLSSLAYRVKNLQITAFIQDPQNHSRLTPVATLLPDAEPADGYTLGPLAAERGPFVFSNTTIVPSAVEALMANSSGLIFRISNYDIIDERGRNFAFSGQEIVERTARLVIDFGGASSLRALVTGEPFDETRPGDETEIHRVATSGGRAIADTNQDGKVDRYPRELFSPTGDSLGIDYDDNGVVDADDAAFEGDTIVVFDGVGKEVGIGLHQAMAAVGLKHYSETNTPTANLSDEEILSSYSTVVVAGREKVYRIRGISNDSLNRKYWEILTPLGVDNITDLNDLVLKPSTPVSLNFVQDLDGDGLTADVEYFLRTSDSDELVPVQVGGVVQMAPRGRDTDKDGLDDRFEALIGWTVSLPNKPNYKVWSSPRRADSNFDGLSDTFVAPGGWNDVNPANGLRDRLNEVYQLNPPPTDWVLDPIRLDTDGDGISDADELAGFVVVPLTGAAPFTRTTNPLNPDTDGDTFSDGFERLVGLDPTDPADIDSDGDGLPDPVEELGWQVTTIAKSTIGFEQGLATTVVRTSNKFDDDSDDDGLTDFEEFFLKTNAKAADTDGDGIADRIELLGYTLGHKVGDDDLGIIKTDVLDADTDNDKRTDGAEAELVDIEQSRWVVRVSGETPYRVFSNPLIADADFDGLVDGDEFSFDPTNANRHTDPNNGNTDGDRRDDGSEVGICTVGCPPGNTNPLAKDLRVTVVAEGIEVTGADSLMQFGFSIRTPEINGVAGLNPVQRIVYQTNPDASSVSQVQHNQGGVYVAALSYEWFMDPTGAGVHTFTEEEACLGVNDSRIYDPGLKGVPDGAYFRAIVNVCGTGQSFNPPQILRYSRTSNSKAIINSGGLLGSSAGASYGGSVSGNLELGTTPLATRSVSFGLADGERFSIEGFATKLMAPPAVNKTKTLGGLEGAKAFQASTSGTPTEVRPVFSWIQVVDKFIEEFYFETTIDGINVKLRFYYIIE